MPFTLTPSAIEKLQADLERVREKPDQAFRLTAIASGGFGMRLDEPAPGDLVLRHGGEVVLVLGPALSDRLADAALDVGTEGDEAEWVLVKGRRS
jgi:hypothetical protein